MLRLLVPQWFHDNKTPANLKRREEWRQERRRGIGWAGAEGEKGGRRHERDGA